MATSDAMVGSLNFDRWLGALLLGALGGGIVLGIEQAVVYFWDFQLRGQLLHGVLPAGVIGLGIAAALPYVFAYRWLGVRIGILFLVLTFVCQTVMYFTVDYFMYLQVSDEIRLATTYWDYFDAATRSVATVNATGGASKGFGVWGYAWRVVEIASITLAAPLVCWPCRHGEYCNSCRRYFSSSEIESLPCEEHMAEEEEGVDDNRNLLGSAADAERLNTMLSAMRQGDRRAVVELAAAAKDEIVSGPIQTAIRWMVKYCPSCGGGHVDGTKITKGDDLFVVELVPRQKLPAPLARQLAKNRRS